MINVLYAKQSEDRSGEFLTVDNILPLFSDAAGMLQEMEEKGIYKMENEELSITYIAPTEREIFDTKRFKEDHPYVYHDYMKTSQVGAQVRFKLK